MRRGARRAAFGGTAARGLLALLAGLVVLFVAARADAQPNASSDPCTRYVPTKGGRAESLLLFYPFEQPDAARFVFGSMIGTLDREGPAKAMAPANALLEFLRRCNAEERVLMRAAHNRALLLLESGEVDRAARELATIEAYFARAKPPPAGEPAGDVTFLVGRAALARARGDRVGARRDLELALRRVPEEYGDDWSYERGVVELNLGVSLFELGLFQEARARFAAAPKPRPSADARWFFRSWEDLEATAQTNLALVDLHDGRTDEARRAVEAALARGPTGALQASLLNNLAEIERSAGRYAEAAVAVQTALAVQRARLGADHPVVANTLHTLAQIERARGDLEAADARYVEALNAARGSLGEDHLLVSMILVDRAMVALARGDGARAAELQLQALDIDERAVASVLPGATEQERRGFMSVVRDHVDAALTTRARAPSAQTAGLAARAVLSHKGRTLDVAAAAASPSREADDARAELARLVFHGPRSSGLARDAYVARLTELHEKAKDATPAALRPLPSDPAAGVRSALGAGDVLVDYLVHRPIDPPTGKPGAPRYVALVLTAGDARWVDLGDAAAIDARTAALRGSLARREPVSEHAVALRRAILDPIGLAGGTRRLLVAPDGALSLIPFEALEDDDGKTLMEWLEVGYLGSAREVLAPRAAPGDGAAPVVLADPRMARAEWPRLPGTLAEARAIAARFPDARVITGPAATRTALRSVRRPGILHVATHGFFVAAARYLTDDGAALAVRGLVLDARPVTAAAAIDPLSRAGLLLSPEREGDDGIVSAVEIARADLRGSLVVLSACETGLGEVSAGQGVYGLRRALVLAGSRRQLISLWKVDDAATSALMTRFYDALRGGAQPSAALRLAKLALRADPATRHPFFWAAFIASGDPDAPSATAPGPGRLPSRGCACETASQPAGGAWPALAPLALGVLAGRRARRRPR